MDIINKQKQQEIATQKAQQRYEEHVRAGEEILGLHPQVRKRRAHSGRGTHDLRRRFLAFTTTVLVFGVGCFVYIGAKAYIATRNMTVTTPAYTTATEPHSEQPTLPTETEHKHVETITVQPAAPEHSFVRDTLSAAGALVGKRTPLRGEDDGQINVLLLGKGTEGHPGENLTDTIMLACIDVTKGKIALFSLPRDLYVRIPETTSATKINALYSYGITHDRGAEPIIAAVSTITHLPIHYFLVADFDAFISIVDALDGINVTVARAINDTTYPGPHYSYETFALDAGLQHLDGATALKYVRTRHNDPEGDFGRAKRQQQVLQAIKNKAFSLGTLSNPLRLGELFDALGAHIRTDMSLAEMSSFAGLLPQLDTHNITTVVVDAWKADSLLRVIHVGKMFALVPRAGRFDYTEVRKSAHTIFERLATERLHSEVAREKPRITIIRAGASAQTVTRVRTLLIDALALTHTDVIIARTQAPARDAHAQIIDYTQTATPFTLTGLLTTLGATLIPVSDAPDEVAADIHVLLGTDADDFFSESAITKEQFDTAESSGNEHVMILTEE